MSPASSMCSRLPFMPRVYTGGCSTTQSSSAVSTLRREVNCCIARQTGTYASWPRSVTIGLAPPRASDVTVARWLIVDGGTYSNYHNHRLTGADLAVNVIQLSPAARGHDGGDAFVFAVAAEAAGDGGFWQRFHVMADDFHHTFAQIAFGMAHYFDREIAREFERGPLLNAVVHADFLAANSHL